jgi:hypothetical protein
LQAWTVRIAGHPAKLKPRIPTGMKAKAVPLNVQMNIAPPSALNAMLRLIKALI